MKVWTLTNQDFEGFLFVILWCWKPTIYNVLLCWMIQHAEQKIDLSLATRPRRQRYGNSSGRVIHGERPESGKRYITALCDTWMLAGTVALLGERIMKFQLSVCRQKLLSFHCSLSNLLQNSFCALGNLLHVFACPV